MCCRNSLSTPFTSREHLGCSDHLPEHHSACTLCTGSAFADPTNVSIPKDRKKPEDTIQSTSWQEVSRTCTMSSCATGSLSSARQPWGAASGRTLGWLLPTALCGCGGSQFSFVCRAGFNFAFCRALHWQKWLLAKVLLCFGWNFLSFWAKMYRRVLIFLSLILLLFRKNGS